ncbi:MAG TPA: hypothetical protein VGW78_05920 [Candidatus Babeliales bacterium]|jgi:hypothetical protein|nr:hypothetical protein [Candidatus Babeliales bacterium]
MNIKNIICITAAATLSLSISGMTPKGSGIDPKKTKSKSFVYIKNTHNAYKQYQVI